MTILAAPLAKLTADRDAIYMALREAAERADNFSRLLRETEARIAVLTARGEALTGAIELFEQAAAQIGVPQAAAAAPAPGRLNIGEAILADLATIPAGRTLVGLCATVGRKPSQVRPALERLLQADRVVGLAGGRYATAEHAAAAA